MGNAVVLTLLVTCYWFRRALQGSSKPLLVVVFAVAFWFAFGYLTLRPQEALAPTADEMTRGGVSPGR